jgi:glycosyltransferase involved in cell wall biosynthesis
MPMRILYCNKYNFPFSGTEVYLFDLMQMMAARGHQVALFSMADKRGGPTPYDRYFVPHINFKDSKHSLLERVRLAAHAVYSRKARYRLGQMIDEFRPDVAHVRNIYHHLSPSVFWELKQRGIPVLYHLNDFKLLCPNYNLVARGKVCERCRGGRFWNIVAEDCYRDGRAAGAVLALEACVHRCLRTYEKCVTRFLAPSEFVRAKLIENGWAADRIDVLPHYQKLPEQMPPGPTADAPILYFGRLSPEKGVSDLLRALRYVPTLRLKIAGDGPSRVDLEELARRIELKNVEFVGHLPAAELHELIRESRFTVFPSRAYETLGKTILESYAEGRTVVASDLGSRREFVQHGKTGLLYQVGNVEELAYALSWLDQHPGLAAEMGRAGREFVREHHSPANHYESMIELYERLAAGTRRVKRETSAVVALAPPSKPRLRVAFIGGRGVIGKYSGIEGYYEEVGRRLAARGHEVTVYCRAFFTPPQSEHNGMRLVRLPTVRSKHFETVLHTALSTLHVSFRPCDIVHYHTLGPALFSLVPRLVGKKTAVTVQGLDWRRKKWGPVARTVLRLGEKAAVWCPDATMVVSRTLWSYFREQYGAETKYVANGALLRDRRPARKILEWGLRPEHYILFLGRFSPEKNCHLLIEAYEKIATEVELVLAGGGNRLDAYYQEILRHASRRVHLLEYVSGDDFDELLTNAMLFVLPSDLEGLSLALLEAMGAGLCVLASDIPENRELVDGAGFLFRPGDGTDLQRMLRLLIEDREVREAAGRAAKQRIQEDYLWPKIVQEIEQTYLEMMGRPDAAPILTAKPTGVRVREPQDGRRAGAAVIPMPVPENTRRAV